MYGDVSVTNEGKINVDGDIINIKMGKHSWIVDEGQPNYAAGGLDLSNVKALHFTFNNNVIALGKPAIKLYAANTDMGKKLMQIQLGKKLWSQEFVDTSSSAKKNKNTTSTKKVESASTGKPKSIVTSKMSKGDFSAFDGQWESTNSQTGSGLYMTIANGKIDFHFRKGIYEYMTDGLKFTTKYGTKGTVSVNQGGESYTDYNTSSSADFTIHLQENVKNDSANHSVDLLFVKAGHAFLKTDKENDRFILVAQPVGTPFTDDGDVMFKK